MSDYYGTADLEDWLRAEVFSVDCKLPGLVLDLFEKWRESIENNIDSWINSDDGYGNTLSWRGWGRGFYAIPDKDIEEFRIKVEVCDMVIHKVNPMSNK